MNFGITLSNRGIPVGLCSGRDMSAFDNVLYHHINVNGDRDDALADSKKFLDLYYSADYSKERLESWLTYGSPQNASSTSSGSRPQAADASRFASRPWVM